jgi:general secretion pathway protein I
MRSEKGFTLLEAVIAIAIMGIIAAAFFSSLAGASKGVATADERATAESLARSQLEYVKSLSGLSDNYTATVPQIYIDSGFSAMIAPPQLIKAGLQKIKITVYHNGRAIIVADGCTLEGYKGER